MATTDRKASIYSSRLWSACLETSAASAESSSKGTGCRESYVYVVGPKRSGKTSIVSRFLRPDTEPKPGSSLVDFLYARKPTVDGRADMASIWELPGADQLARALAIKDKNAKGVPLPAFFLPAKAVNTGVVVIAADLSRPASVLDECCEWIRLINNALQEQYHLLESKGSKLPEQLRSRAQKVNFAGTPNHPDKDQIAFPGIQVLVCACKYDLLASTNLATRTAVSRGLRCMAHAHGAHLCYLGHASPGSGSQSSSESRAEVEDMQKKLRTILTHVVFTGFDKKLPIELIRRDSRTKQHPDVEPDGPLCILHGTDSFKAIGMPEGQSAVSAADRVTAWRNHLRTVSPAPAPPPEPPTISSLLPDEGIDSLVRRLEQDLEIKVTQSNALADKQNALRAKKAQGSKSPKKARTSKASN